MSGLLAFVPLLLFPQWLNWAAVQAMVAALLLLVLLLARSPRTPFFLPRFALPWLLWPLFLFARAPAQLEFFSENSLRLFALGALGLLILANHEQPRLSRRLALLGALCTLLVQLYGQITHHSFLAQNSVYAQENVYQFVNLMVIGLACWVFFFSSETRFWRALAGAVGLGALLSLAYGDTAARGHWNISAGDSIGAWLGLICGLTAAGGAWFWARRRWSPLLLATFGGVIVLLWALLPILCVYVPLWNAQQPSSITSRLTFWQAAWALIQDNRWFGVGYGAFGAHIQNYWPPLQTVLMRLYAFPIAAHSHQLHVWVETGTVGWLGSVFLWGSPWIVALYGYARSRKPRLLFWIAVLAALQSAMVVLEVSQMFLTPQLAAWIALLYAVRELGLPAPHRMALRTAWLWLFLPLVGLLLWDRGWQLRSQYLSAPCELMGRVAPEQVANLNAALVAHPKNAPALYYIAELQRMDSNFTEALQAVDALQEISGTQWPVHRMRAEIYHAMGNETEACRQAQWPLLHSAQKRDQDLKALLHCE